MRQEMEDEALINPATGLPKHVYDFKHPECLLPSIQGAFQYKGKKYHTRRFEYHPDGVEGVATREMATSSALQAVDALKDATEGYREYVRTRGHRTTVRKKTKVVYQNQVSKQNHRQSCTVLENVRTGNYTIRRI